MLAGSIALTALVVFNLTPVYTAKSTVLIEPQVPQVMQTRDAAAEPLTSLDHDYYKTQYDILRSRSLAAKVIVALGLADQPLFSGNTKPVGLIGGLWSGLRDAIAPLTGSAAPTHSDPMGVPVQAIDAYLSRLQVEPGVGTQLVEVTFTTPDPNLSARITNAHVDAYIRRGMELKSDAARNAEQFLQGKLDELKDKVEKSEAALNAYRREHGVITFSLDERSKGEMLEQRLTALNDALAKLEAERIALEVQHELILKGEADSLPAVMQNPLIQQLKQQVAEQAAQYAAMSSEFNPGYYQPLDKLKAKLDQSRVQLAQEVRRAGREVDADYNAAAAREQMLQDDIAKVKADALSLNDASLQDTVLVREVAASR